MSNLKTVSYSNKSRRLDIFDGWYVNPTDKGETFIEGLGVLTKAPRVTHQRGRGHYIHEISVGKKQVEIQLPVSKEDAFPATPKTFITYQVILKPKADNKVYYRVFMDGISSLSKDFEIILKSSCEDPFEADKHIPVIYAALPKDLPLILDTKGNLCVSPM